MIRRLWVPLALAALFGGIAFGAPEILERLRGPAPLVFENPCATLRGGPVARRPQNRPVFTVTPRVNGPWRLYAFDLLGRRGRAYWGHAGLDSVDRDIPLPNRKGGRQFEVRSVGCPAGPVALPDVRRVTLPTGYKAHFHEQQQTLEIEWDGPKPLGFAYLINSAFTSSPKKMRIERNPAKHHVSLEGLRLGPEARAVVREARSLRSLWDRWLFLRDRLGDKQVTGEARGPTPVFDRNSIDRVVVEEFVSTSEYLRARAILARAVGIPTRIGVGYWRPDSDGTFWSNDRRQFLEVLSADGVWIPLTRDGVFRTA